MKQLCIKKETTMISSDIFKELSAQFAGNRIRKPYEIDFTLKDGNLSVKILSPCLNMQKNQAAFEAWIVALKANMENSIDRVQIEVDETADKSEKLHYNRFKWRLYNFTKMYDWVDLSPLLQTEVNGFIDNVFIDLKINKPSRPREKQPAIGTEGYIEWLLVNKYKDILYEKIKSDKLYNQVPVGVFRQKVSNESAIFSCKKSAIDLIGLDTKDKILHLIELKKGGNYSIGIISEFLFYSHIIYNIFIEKSIKYDSRIELDGWDEYQNFIDHGASKIKAHLLVEKIHPLINKPTIDLLNEGLSKQKMSVDFIPYTFRNGEIHL